MKYLEKYIEEKLKIKILGELTTRDSFEGESVGVSLVIDGYEPGIEVWYVDYATWLEEKLDAKEQEENEKNYMTLDEFRNDVMSAMDNKPADWRPGQFVFNYIDERYGVARNVQFIDGVDCFYNDNKIEEFIDRAYMFFIGMDNETNLV